MAQPRRLGESTAEPLRLAADEATALLVAARAVATLPGLREGDRQALLRATAKLEAAAGEVAGASSRLSVTFESEGGVFADVDRAIAERRRLWLRYYSPARDELTERKVDPIRLFAVGHTYMEGWCHLSEARRTFRLDRVAEIRLLDERAEPPPSSPAICPRGWCSRPPRIRRSWSRWVPAGAGWRSTTRTTVRRSCPRGSADHLAHPRSGFAAAPGAAAGPGGADRGPRGAGGQRPPGGPGGTRRL